MVALDLEQKLQKAFNYSAAYLGITPPEILINKDFDIDKLIGQDITALTSLFEQGILDRTEYRQLLVQGEVLPSGNKIQPNLKNNITCSNILEYRQT